MSDALERARRHLDPANWRAVPRTNETELIRALLAEHEALLRRVADAPVREVIAHHVQGRDMEAIGFKWDEKPLPSLIGQRVRILAEPGEG